MGNFFLVDTFSTSSAAPGSDALAARGTQTIHSGSISCVYCLPIRTQIEGKLMRKAVAVVAVGVLLIAACGSDDDESSEEAAAFCGDFLEANTQVALLETPAGDPEAMGAAVEAAAASAPDDVSADVEVMAGFAQSGGEGDFEEFQQAQESVIGWINDNCDVGTVDAVAVDYAYEDFPDTIDAGATSISLTNEGSELHEAVVLKLNDGVELNAEELLALPEEEVLPQVTIMGAAFAEPGSAGQDIFDLSAPGDYVVVCFITVGTTAEALAEAEATGVEPEGPPHFTQGMFQEFTVE